LLTHGDTITNLGEELEVIATSGTIIAGIQNVQKNIYGVQFHPEVDLTDFGKEIFKNFLFDVAKLSGSFTLQDREQIAIQYIHDKVKDKKVLVLCSGGVDSTVCASLLTKAIGPQKIYAVHIDNGFMRKEESKKVKEALEKQGLKLDVVDASETFYTAKTLIKTIETLPLNQTCNPEQKRKIIGDTFMKVAETEIKRLNLDPSEIFVAQGTLRPDLIESASELASASAAAIKTHHNDTELVRELRKKGRVIEPLTDYHKDEVRELGTSLGLPDDLVWRQPFPGPGLAIRILCAEKPFKDESFESTNQILNDILHKETKILHQLDTNVSQKHLEEKMEKIQTTDLWATLLPVQTVGVQGDTRTYSYVAALSGKRDWETLFSLAKLIPQLCHNINRVVYVFGDPVEGPIHDITPTYLTPDVISKLQEADDIVNSALIEHKLTRVLSQVPVILFPVPFGKKNNRSIAIRTFITNDFMTGIPAIPGKELPEDVLLKVVSQVQAIDGISRVVYDLTAKPPGTTEWE